MVDTTPSVMSVPVVTTIGLSPLQKRGVALPLSDAGAKSSLSEGSRCCSAGVGWVGASGAAAAASGDAVVAAIVVETTGSAAGAAAAVRVGLFCRSHFCRNQRSTGRPSGSLWSSSRYCLTSPSDLRLSLASERRASGTVMYHQYPNGTAIAKAVIPS